MSKVKNSKIDVRSTFKSIGTRITKIMDWLAKGRDGSIPCAG